jgi:hypothetical protein
MKRTDARALALQVLFSTETFAMGVNMPAKTVLFTALRKWDGEENRWMGSGEYIQMSGRAGRRGQDDRGTVVMMADDALDEETCKGLVHGAAAPLLSSFKLSYYTLINLMRRAESSGALPRISRSSLLCVRVILNPNPEQEEAVGCSLCRLGRDSLGTIHRCVCCWCRWRRQHGARDQPLVQPVPA